MLDLVEEYRRRAGVCRLRARTVSPKAHRERLHEMAAEWESLADQREAYHEGNPGEPRVSYRGGR